MGGLILLSIRGKILPYPKETSSLLKSCTGCSEGHVILLRQYSLGLGCLSLSYYATPGKVSRYKFMYFSTSPCREAQTLLEVWQPLAAPNYLDLCHLRRWHKPE